MAKNCVDEVLEYMQKKDPEISKKEVEKVVKKLRELKKKYDGDVPRMTEDAQTFLNNYRNARARAIKSKALTAAKLEADLTRFDSDPLFKRRPDKFFRAKLTGIEGLAKGGNDSVHVNYSSYKARMENMLLNQLDRVGLTKVFADGSLDKEIMIEMFELRKGGKPGRSGSPQAKEIAGIINKTQNYKLKVFEDLGYPINELDGYIMRQTHDEAKVSSVDFKTWSADMKSYLDMERTFGGMSQTEIDDALYEGYQKIVDGTYSREFFTNQNPELGSSRIYDSLQERLRKGRAYHYKNGESLFEYNQKYGMNNFAQTIWRGMDKSARDAATLKVLGGSPSSYMLQLKQAIGQRIKEEGGDWKKLSGKWRSIEKLYDEAVRYTTRVPGNNLAAKSSRSLTAIQVLSKLGLSLFPSISDLGTSIGALKSATGKGFFDSTASLVKNYFSLVPKSERVKWAKRLEIQIQDITGGHFDRFGAGMESPANPGLIYRGSRSFMRLTGLETHTDIGTVANAKQFAFELADNASSSFDGLSSRMRANLERYGINDKEWSVISKGVETINGERAITPEAIRELPDSAFKSTFVESPLTPNISSHKNLLADKVSNYLSDNARVGVPMGSPEERALLLQGTREDEPFGALLRVITQFKTFPLSMVRVMGRIGLSNPDKAARTLSEMRLNNTDIEALAGTFASLTLLGYVAYSAKQVLAGKEPPSPNDPETIAQAMVQGGAAGLYGDFLNSLVNQKYGSAVGDLLGPTAGNVDDLSEILSGAVRGEDVGAKTFRTIWRNTPGNNVWFAKTALDYMIYYNIMEYLSPGFKDRMESRLEERPGLINEERQFLIEP